MYEIDRVIFFITDHKSRTHSIDFF